MNEDIADVETATEEVVDRPSLFPFDSPTQAEETFPIEADARAISDARLYLVAMGAFFSGFPGKR